MRTSNAPDISTWGRLYIICAHVNRLDNGCQSLDQLSINVNIWYQIHVGFGTRDRKMRYIKVFLDIIYENIRIS